MPSGLIRLPGDLVADLLHQAITATDDHAQVSKPDKSFVD
jgi:hypothetical protein